VFGLDLFDFLSNPSALELGRYRLCQYRYLPIFMTLKYLFFTAVLAEKVPNVFWLLTPDGIVSIITNDVHAMSLSVFVMGLSAIFTL